MEKTPDQQVFESAAGVGCFAFVIALALIPLFFPAYVLYKLATAAGAGRLHPAILLALAALTIWGLWRLGGLMIRSVPPRVARTVIAVYVAACYTMALFERQLTTARAGLDVAWLAFAFAVFLFIGWKIGGAMVLKAHRDRLLRVRRKQEGGA